MCLLVVIVQDCFFGDGRVRVFLANFLSITSLDWSPRPRLPHRLIPLPTTSAQVTDHTLSRHPRSHLHPHAYPHPHPYPHPHSHPHPHPQASECVIPPGRDIQPELDRLAASGGGTCTLLAGTHAVRAPLVLHANTELAGEGRDNTILQSHMLRPEVMLPLCAYPRGNCAVITVDNHSRENITIRDLAIDGGMDAWYVQNAATRCGLAPAYAGDPCPPCDRCTSHARLHVIVYTHSHIHAHSLTQPCTLTHTAMHTHSHTRADLHAREHRYPRPT